jgi:hypothetical protein
VKSQKVEVRKSIAQPFDCVETMASDLVFKVHNKVCESNYLAETCTTASHAVLENKLAECGGVLRLDGLDGSIQPASSAFSSGLAVSRPSGIWEEF